jgi:pimeloyl-ACP methyl ester carboxylesterase
MVSWDKSAERITALFAFLVLAQVACGGAEEPEPIVVPAGALSGDLIGLESCDYEVGEDVHAADCGTLVVPENREDSNSKLIALPITRIRAIATVPDEPIFWLGGGPGKSNMRFTHKEDLESLITNHDIVTVGYRGMDGSMVLDCPEISQALKNPPDDLLSDASLESYGAAGARCAERLQGSGVDLAGYTMTETINDMEDTRMAMGYERINLLGASYGTRLAMIYEWMYPESLFRIVMAAVNPPGHFV